MKTLVLFLSSTVQKRPVVVVVATILITLVLGMGLGGQFLPEEDSNSSFAPDAPELVASTYIAETFGSVGRMQVMTSSDTGDVITLDGLLAAQAAESSLRSGDAAEFLVDAGNSTAVFGYLAPVQFAIQAGQPTPSSDAEVKALYTAGLEMLPSTARPFVVALVSDDYDPDTVTATYGLTSVSYESSDDFDIASNRAVLMADAVWAADAPADVTLDPFSQELIFGSSDDFQQEILRLFASAGFIILLVLATVFLVRPESSRDRGMFIAGIVLMTVGAAVSVAPGLALLMPDVFPASWGDAALGMVLLTAVTFYAAAFVLWSVTSRRLRRAVADTLLTFLTIALVIMWMNGYGFLRFGDQSQMVQILPILLIGLGVDYSIHVNTRYRQELSAGSSVDRSISIAIRTVGVALVLATVTTAVGFLTNVTNDIPALAEFGELAAVGILFAFLLMLTFVPAVRELLDRRAEKNGRLDTDGLEAGDSRVLPRLMAKTAILPRRYAAATVIVSLVLAGVGAFGLSQLETKFSFLDFVPTTSPLRDTAITIDENFEFPESTSVLVQGDVASGAAWNTMLQGFAAAGEVENVVTFDTPSGAFPAGSTFMGAMFQFLDPGAPSYDADMFNAALLAGFGQDRRVPDDADLTAFYDVAYRNHPEVIPSVLAVENGSYVATLSNFDTTAGEVDVANLADDLNGVYEPTGAAGLTSITTSGFIISNLVVTSLRESQQSSLLLTLGAALLLLVINFWYESRRPMLGVVTTVPVAMVVLWTFGIMAALGIPFGPVTAMISAIGIGIGIPYMIHVTHRYLEERGTSEDENEAARQTLMFTGGALAGSALTTIFGFGILMTSTTIPFQQFGLVIAYTILLALVAAVLVLPSMLVLWSRWHMKRGDVPAKLERIGGDA